MAINSSTIAWKIPWTEEPGRLQSVAESFLSLLAILWNSAFRWVYLSFSPLPFTSPPFTAICKASSGRRFAFFAFLFLGDSYLTPLFTWQKPGSSIKVKCLLAVCGTVVTGRVQSKPVGFL